MNHGARFIPIRHVRHAGRMLATLVTLPALVMSPFTAQAILIHDHHGHDTHSHALGVHELEELRRNPEHQHPEHQHGGHEHDGPAVVPPDGEGSSLVILLDSPEGLARGRISSGRAADAVPGSPFVPFVPVVAFVAHQLDGSNAARPFNLAPPMRARGSLEGILLTSHALLL